MPGPTAAICTARPAASWSNRVRASAFAIARDDYSDLPILLVLSLLGFVGSVALARFFAGRSR